MASEYQLKEDGSGGSGTTISATLSSEVGTGGASLVGINSTGSDLRTKYFKVGAGLSLVTDGTTLTLGNTQRLDNRLWTVR